MKLVNLIELTALIESRQVNSNDSFMQEEILEEGFFDFSVNAYDSASKLYDGALDCVAKELRKELFNNKRSEDDTHGTFNVAMVIAEKFNDFMDNTAMITLARDVIDMLTEEINARDSSTDAYTKAMQRTLKKLKALI